MKETTLWDAEKQIKFNEKYTKKNFEHDAKDTEILFKFLSPVNRVFFKERLVTLINLEATEKDGWGDKKVRETWQYLVTNQENRDWLKSMPKDQWKEVEENIRSRAARLKLGPQVRLLHAKLRSLSGRFFKGKNP